MNPVTDALLLAALALLIGLLALGLLRALRGPTLEDRMSAILLLGSGGVAILVLLFPVVDVPALLDVALLLALLAAVAAAALTREEASGD